MPFEPELDGLRVSFLAGTLGQGGAEQQLFYLLKTLKACGASVQLLSLTRGEFWEEPIRRLGVPVRWVGRVPLRAARLIYIMRELRGHPPQILQSQHFYANLYASLAARAFGLRDIGAVRNDVWSEVRSNGQILGRLSLRVPRTLAANSGAAIRNAIESGIAPHRLHLLPNVVDIDRFQPLPPRNEEKIRILAVGRMMRQKRHDRLLRVLAGVHRRARRPVEAMIAGDGPQREEIQHQAAALGLDVKFLGRVADLAPVYRSADIFLLTSDHEGTPNVVLEAMACGLPVVGTRVGGVPEIIEHGISGFLADTAREDVLIELLLELIERPDKRLEVGASARRRVEQSYSPQSLPCTLKRLYAAALA